MMPISNQPCPCGRSKSYGDCCLMPHQNVTNSKTAEDLMRSRYAAFTMGNGDYLLTSHHTSTRPSSEIKQLVSWAKSVKWVKLEVLNTTGGGEDDLEGTVEFKAHLYENSKKVVMHQNGKFVREFGHWVYFDLVE